MPLVRLLGKRGGSGRHRDHLIVGSSLRMIVVHFEFEVRHVSLELVLEVLGRLCAIVIGLRPISLEILSKFVR